MDIRKESAADIARIRSVAHYRRFGFLPARQFGIRNEYTEGDEIMIAALVGAAMPVNAMVEYQPEFAGLERQ